MTAPEPPPTAQPSVQTAPAGSGHWWSSVPRHLGRVRTSTVVLAALWLATFVLYVYVRPDPAVTGAASTGSTGGTVQQPAPTSTAPRTTARPTTTAPTTTPPRSSTSGTSSSATRTTSPSDTATVPTTPPPTSIEPPLSTGGSGPTT